MGKKRTKERLEALKENLKPDEIENGKRYKYCIKCGELWNVSFHLKDTFYTCPRCERKEI